VGDSDCDVTTAARLGLGFVGIAADGNDAVLRAAGAQLVLRDYTGFRHIHEDTRNCQAGGVNLSGGIREKISVHLAIGGAR
jgi:hypothetical protein